MITTNSVGLSTTLCLPAPDVKALGDGRSICAITSIFIRPGQQFLLCPSETLDNSEHLEWCYQDDFQPIARQSLELLELDMPEIKYWATCEKCLMIEDENKISAFSALSIWKEEWLRSKSSIFVTILRVHHLSSEFNLPAEIDYQGKLGKFFSISASQAATIHQPVLSDSLFDQRKEQLENFKPPEHPELEELQSTIACYAQGHPEAQSFSHELQQFLGWSESKAPASQFDKWISEITTSGNSSDGDLFEKRVRRAFIELGFTNTLKNIKASLDPNSTGGAGGIDIYCEKPYSIVGECKASKNENVPNSVSAQLIHLGTTHLGKDIFDPSIKIIFAAGKLTDHAEKSAIENQMNVMRPETLQRLVELKITHPGSIDLLELKPCLEDAPFGIDADTKINEFIDKVYQRLNIRSHIIRSVKALKDDGDDHVTASTVRTHFNTAFGPNLEKLENPEQAHTFLIELSSPLTGYLGRTKGANWKSDRFYFLRELVV